MSFAGFSILAVILAAIAGFAVGSVWYGVLGKQWMTAVGLTEADIRRRGNGRPPIMPFVTAAIADLVMAAMLAGIIGHLGENQVTIWNGIVSGFFCWIGFIATTIAVNNAFAMRPMELTAIDAGHWLVVLLVMGTVIGAVG
ncbi:MAG: DUF1761 domain-containing protein [Hyphomicrobiales bacterium]|nr:DUF1761 domain-containing protein [Hyphomicrobiales bacterium]